MQQVISTPLAPIAIGVYSQAVKTGNTIYISGQMGLDPLTMEMVSGSFADQVHRIVENIQAISNAAGTDLSAMLKMTVYLKDMSYFDELNSILQTVLAPPYPARAAVAVSGLPRQALVEMDAILVTHAEGNPAV